MILTHVTHIVNPYREEFSGPVDVPLGQWLGSKCIRADATGFLF